MRKLSRFSKLLAALVVSMTAWLPTHAFTLLGPFATWQTPTIGYALAGDGEGPMNINEGYRWTIPVMTYAIDATFEKYFGAEGIAAIDQAMALWNAVPAADLMTTNLSEFPLDAIRINSTAGSLSLYDVKTFVLATMLEQLGLGPAERYAWTIRYQWPIPNTTPQLYTYDVIQRNWDPVTWNPSSSVNGVLYSYNVFQTYTTPTWEAVEFQARPLPRSPRSLSLASLYGIEGGTIDPALDFAATFGVFYNSLTRDDAGGIRYLYSTKNLATETLPGDAVVASGTIASVGAGGSTPWTPYISIASLTNLTTTTSNAITPTTTPRIVTAVRPGIGKIKFTKLEYDSLVGSTMAPYSVAWVDRYYTNGTMHAQSVQRIITHPDIVFGAGDLGIAVNVPFRFERTENYVSQSTLNNDLIDGSEQDGPGIILPRISMTFSNAGRNLFNTPFTGFSEATGTVVFTWGSYDGSTNAPIVFPNGYSLMQLQSDVLSGH